MVESPEHQWQSLCRATLANSAQSQCFKELLQYYNEAGRSYHNLEHILACLEEFRPLRTLAVHQEALEFAIWFHDAIYDTLANDNEAQSAALAITMLQTMGLPEELQQQVHELIMATCHKSEPDNIDAKLMADIDLSILGKAPDIFWHYERAIRQEYAWVPEAMFNSKRAQILESFCARAHIYHTGHFRAQYETRARSNLRAAIERLRNAKT